uniref:Uncharacterized protein n=1 Tax=Brassica oleracea TaxID=3712 RepID=A0A3P6GFF8_BRAOL|nr:unnamed protein product [Brassica oleracea]
MRRRETPSCPSHSQEEEEEKKKKKKKLRCCLRMTAVAAV